MTLFGSLEDLRRRPIPGIEDARKARKGYRQLPINRADPRGAETVREVRDAGLKGENYYFTPMNPPYWRKCDGAIEGLYLRETVLAKLLKVNARLAEAGLALFIHDAWRPQSVQAFFHDVWMPGELSRRNPQLKGAALREEVERYWAAPSIDANSPAPHETGAATDLTLVWKNGRSAWMGSIFDDLTALAHRDRFENLSDNALSFSDEEARANRRLLHWVMIEEGFAGHPDEWWHYSFGDQLWAKLTGGTAFYGLTKPTT